MKRKAQVINIDWSIGLGLLILTLASSILMMAEYQPYSPENPLENKARDTQLEIMEESSIDGFKNSILISSDYQVSNIPLDRKYSFREEVYPGSGHVEGGGDVKIEDERLITVLDAGNHSKDMVYFTENVSNISYTDDIETGDRINNSKISVDPEAPGLQSLKVNGKELLNSSADLSGNDFSTEDHGFYGSSLSGDLKVYNNSGEIIMENISNPVFNLKNLSTLYWYANNSKTELEGTGDFKSGRTKGLTVASDYGISFVGNISANVSKPDYGTVRVEINADRLRVRLHNSDYREGWRRTKFYDEGYIVVSGRQEISGVQRKKLEELENSSDTVFEENLGLDGWGYNITISEAEGKSLLEKGDEIPFRDAATLEMGLPGLNRTGSFETFKSRVTVWR